MNIRSMVVRVAVPALAIGALLPGAFLAQGANASSTSPTAANEWVLGSTDSTPSAPDFAQPGDQIEATTLTLVIAGTYNGALAEVVCQNVPVTGFTYTVPSPVPSGVAPAVLTAEFDTPTTTLSGCIETADGGPVDVTFATGSQWTVQIPFPAAPDPAPANGTPYTAELPGGMLTIPTGSSGTGTVTITAPTLAPNPCVISAPAGSDLPVPFSYTPGTATYIPPSPLPTFGVHDVSCDNLVGPTASLESASVTLQWSSGKTPTFVWESS